MKRQFRKPRSGEVESFILRRSDSAKVYRDAEIRFSPCPVCRHGSKNAAAQINKASGLWRCFACDAKGNLFTLARAFGEEIADQFEDQILPTINIDWVNFFKTKKRRLLSGGHHKELLEYVNARGIGELTLDKWRITSLGPKAIRIPFYQWDEQTGNWQLVNARIRVCLDRETASTTDWFEMKGGPTGLLMGNHLINLDGPKRAWIFEGQWDAMTATELGIENAFSLPNGCSNINVGTMLRYVPDDWDIVVCTDHDSAGEDAAEKFFAQLGGNRVARLRIPDGHKDLNEWALAAFIEKEDVFNAVASLSMKTVESKKFQYRKFNMGARDIERKIVAKTPWSKLNELLSGGFAESEITSFLAASGGGKTTISYHISVEAAFQSTKVGLIALEGSRLELDRNLAIIATSNYDEKQVHLFDDNLIISPLEGNDISADEIIAQVEDMIEIGCKLIIVDNLDFICRTNNDLKAAIFGKLIDLAVIRKIHMFVVWQPNKVDSSKMVRSMNQKGYSQFYQDSHNYINFNIIVQDGVSYRVMEVEKHRANGLSVDRYVYLQYDADFRICNEVHNFKRSERIKSKIIDL